MTHPYEALARDKFWATGVKTSYVEDFPTFDFTPISKLIKLLKPYRPLVLVLLNTLVKI